MVKDQIAVVGIGCRFPGGGDSPDRFWSLLLNGVDAIGDTPKDRWDFRRFYHDDGAVPGKTHTTKGGFLAENIYKFDPGFFGISPREAETLDPQQRLLLEVSYEAIEDAGLRIEDLENTDTGVFIGGFTLDNYVNANGKDSRLAIANHTATNTTMTLLSNRISHQFDLKGPSVSLDTACSSSLVAVHYACQSLWNGESSLAIVGGVNVMLLPVLSIVLTKGGFLSKNGRCSFLDAQADGYVRGEGAGVVILKPYAAAINDNDDIYATIKASGVNHDGRTSSITAPSGEAQRALMRRVYDEAAIDINRVHYIEAHGTGTQVGDLTEVSSLNAILAGKKSKSKCFVGSVKTNIGHLEAAAGIASLIKAALCLKKQTIPPSLHLNQFNPNIEQDALCLTPVRKAERLPKYERSLVSVNGFGYGGANAHLVLEQVETRKVSRSPRDTSSWTAPAIAPISAKSKTAAQDLAAKYAEFLTAREPDFHDFLHSLIYRKSHHPYRVAIVSNSRDELLEGLKKYAGGWSAPDIVENRVYAKRRPKVAFVLTGMGPQWWRMGRDLYTAFPRFRTKLQECDEIFHKHAGWSILDEFLRNEQMSRMGETQVAQPAIALLQIGLAELLKKYGIRPDIVVGHSVGEVAASYIAGALSLEDALLVSYHRSRLQQQVAGRGGMLAVNMAPERMRALLSEYPTVSLAAINSPQSVTLSGPTDALAGIAEQLTTQKIFNRMLNVEVPYHSPAMEILEEALLQVLQDIQPRPAEIPIYSTATGVVGAEFIPDAQYWYNNIRRPVLFGPAIAKIAEDHECIFLQVGPHPVLQASLLECLSGSETSPHVLSTLNRKEFEVAAFIRCVAALHTCGVGLDWSAFDIDGRFIRLPKYVWQRKTYWSETAKSKEDRLGLPNNPFHNTRATTPHPAWEVELNRFFFPFLSDHKVGDRVVFPGAGYVAAALEAARAVFRQSTSFTLKNVQFHKLLIHDDHTVTILHSAVDPTAGDFSLHSRKATDPEYSWTRHATAHIEPNDTLLSKPNVDLQGMRRRCAQELEVSEVYAKLEVMNLRYGPHFRCIDRIYKGTDEIVVHITGHGSLEDCSNDFLLHPTYLDACFQGLVGFADGQFLPTGIEKVTFYSTPAAVSIGCIQITSVGETTIKGNASLCNERGEIYVSIVGIQCDRIANVDADVDDKTNALFYKFRWFESDGPLDSLTSTGKIAWLIMSDESELALQLGQLLAEMGHEQAVVHRGREFAKVGTNQYEVGRDIERDLCECLRELASNAEYVRILYLWSLDSNSELPGDDVIKQHLLPISTLVRAVDSSLKDKKIRLSIVLRGTEWVSSLDSQMTLAASGLWGIGRLIKNEHPGIYTQVVDLEGGKASTRATATSESQWLIREMLAASPDNHVAFRSTQRYVKLLVNERLQGRKTRIGNGKTSATIQFGAEKRGVAVSHLECERVLPKHNEVEININCLALDVDELSRRLDSGDVDAAADVECLGITVAVGNQVREYVRGENVILWQPCGQLRTYVSVKSAEAIRRADWMTDRQALALLPCMRAVYALREVAHIGPHHSLLVGDPLSDVGRAAIEYATLVGSRLLVTAASEEQRETLRRLGVRHIFDPNRVSIVDEVMTDTANMGVDVIVNSHANGEAYQYIRLLRSNGRFLDCSSGQLLSPRKVLVDLTNASDFGFTKVRTIDIAPFDQSLVEYCSDMIRGMSARDAGLRLPMHNVTLSEAKGVLRSTENGSYGKTIVALGVGEITVICTDSVRKDATYLVTGGTSGLGLEIAGWLASKGARGIGLLSRTGMKSGRAMDAIRRIGANGTVVKVEACDVSDQKELGAAIDRIEREAGPLGGVFHCAMVLDDGRLIDMTSEKYREVWRPKAMGAFNLHELTRDKPLDCFVLLSSVSSLIGNPGQANYVAANSYLEGLAHWRRQRGLPATAVNLGVLEDTGVLSGDSRLRELLKKGGVNGLSTRQVLSGLDAIMRRQPIQVGLFDIDWVRFQESPLLQGGSSILDRIYSRNLTGESGAKKRRVFSARLKGLGKNGVRQVFENLLVSELSKVLKVGRNEVDVRQKIDVLGIDSLMAVEVVARIMDESGFQVPVIEVLAGPSIQELAGTIEGFVFRDLGDTPELAQTVFEGWK